jgi:hypothetical protein
VRATGDLDVWVRAAPDNAVRVMKALEQFGAPLHDLTPADLSQAGVVFQVGVAPLRIDILTGIDGVTFDDAWPARVRTKVFEQPVGVLSIEHLIRNKRAVGRVQDLADLEWLENPDKRER